MDTFSALLTRCGESANDSSYNQPIMQSFGVVFVLSLNKLIKKESFGAIWDAILLNGLC